MANTPLPLPQWVIDIGTYLQTNGVGTLGTDIFYNGFDSINPNCISLDASAGLPAIPSLDNTSIMFRPHLGIRVKNKNDLTGWSKIVQIHTLLNLLVNTRICSTRFKRIQAISDPFLVSNGINEGFIYSVNFYMYIG